MIQSKEILMVFLEQKIQRKRMIIGNQIELVNDFPFHWIIRRFMIEIRIKRVMSILKIRIVVLFLDLLSIVCSTCPDLLLRIFVLLILFLSFCRLSLWSFAFSSFFVCFFVLNIDQTKSSGWLF